tara:strand:- start:799 stop:1959 length:1161 start_codon:yes stop_codon:yes gene_type:complete
MPFYKFGSNDIFNNVVKTHPQCKFLIYSGSHGAGSVFYNNKPYIPGIFASNVPHVPIGHISLYEINVDRPSGELIYPFVTKGGTLASFKTISVGDFNNSGKFSYGDAMTGSYPLSASISKDLYAAGATRSRVDALRNALNYYTPSSRHYAYSSSFGDKSTQAVGLISIPSIFYGSSIKKGSVNLRYYLTGTLIGELQDKERNGELVEVSGSNTGNIAGVVLYNEGFILLTGSWDLDSSYQEQYDGSGNDNPKWIYYGQSISSSVDVPYSSFEMEFKGTNYVPVLTMLAHAPTAELNYSANPTYVEHGQNITPLTSSVHYIENRELNIKNTVSSSYPDPTGSFKKQTFISKIGIFDEKKNLIAIAKVAKPVKKTENRDFTFKLKLDF